MDDYKKNQMRTKILAIGLLVITIIVIAFFVFFGGKIEASYNKHYNNTTKIESSVSSDSNFSDPFKDELFSQKFDYFIVELNNGNYKIYNNSSSFNGNYEVKNNQIICYFDCHTTKTGTEYAIGKYKGFIFELDEKSNLILNEGVNKNDFDNLIF